MDTARYRAFVEAVDKGSLSQAAKTLNYTPSGVSQLISALERDLGFPLLERTKHGVRLTKTGETLLPVVRAVVQEEERLKEMSSEINGLTIGSVTIGSYPSVATHWLPKVIKTFHEHYPKIEIRVMEGIHQEIDDWLSTYQVDLAFMSQAPNSPYEWIPLGTDSMVAVLSLDHPLAHADYYPIERVEEEAFIMPGLGHDIDTMHVLEKYNLKPHVVIETIENASMLAMVEQGMGMSVVNSLLTKKLNFDIALVPIKPEDSIIFGLAIQSLSDASPAVRRFAEYAIDQLNQLP